MTKGARKYNGVKTVYSKRDIEKIGQIHVKNETTPPSYAIYKNKFKLD